MERDFAKCFACEKAIQTVCRTFLPMPGAGSYINHFLHAAISSNWLDWLAVISILRNAIRMLQNTILISISLRKGLPYGESCHNQVHTACSPQIYIWNSGIPVKQMQK